MQVALAMIVAGALFLPWLPVTMHGLSSKFDTAYVATSFEQAVTIFVRFLSNDSWIILLAGLAAGVFRSRTRIARQRMFPFLWLAVVVLVLLLSVNEAVGLIPLRRSRYFFVTWSMWIVVMGWCLAAIRPRWIALLVLAAYLAAGFALRRSDGYLEYQGTVGVVSMYPPLAEYVDVLKGMVDEQDFVLGFSSTDFVNAPGKRGKSTAEYYMEALLGGDGAFVQHSLEADALASDLPRKLDNHPYVLLTYNPLSPPANLQQVGDYLSHSFIGPVTSLSTGRISSSSATSTKR